MTVIEKDDKILYRADKGKKVKFKNNTHLYSEICVNKDDKREVVEVDA